MLTIKSFAGINNVLPSVRLPDSAQAVATNVDFGLSGEVSRRGGFAKTADDCHESIHQGDGFMLAVQDGDLFAVGGPLLYQSLGNSRVWYCNLPDGRAAFSNGFINGVTDGASLTKWGNPVPASVGAVTDIDGDLFPGEYRYALSYVRKSDGLEGGVIHSAPFQVSGGGVFLSGLPVEPGYSINVYLTSQHGGSFYLAGNATGGVFSFTGSNDSLVLPCKVESVSAAPVGTVMALWHGRVLIACGNVLNASLPFRHEQFDLERDFKQFTAPITLIQPVDDGLYVGTTSALYFLAGSSFDNLAMSQVLEAPVVLGSGVCAPGELIVVGDGKGSGTAMLCIADKGIVAGFNGGQIVKLTEGTYETLATEVFASFRKVGGIPQYMASLP